MPFPFHINKMSRNANEIHYQYRKNIEQYKFYFPKIFVGKKKNHRWFNLDKSWFRKCSMCSFIFFRNVSIEHDFPYRTFGVRSVVSFSFSHLHEFAWHQTFNLLSIYETMRCWILIWMCVCREIYIFIYFWLEDAFNLELSTKKIYCYKNVGIQSLNRYS